MFWTRKAAHYSPLYAPAGTSEPMLAEVDALLLKGDKAGELSANDAARLNTLARAIGFGAEASALEEAFDKRLKLLKA